MAFASAQELCDWALCDPTWTAVESNHAYCASCANGKYIAGNCGDYRVLTYIGVDTGGSYYYRRDTGTLVAAEFWGSPSPTATCWVVGTEKFALPATCDMTTFSMLPGWCSPDAGAADATLPSVCLDGGVSP